MSYDYKVQHRQADGMEIVQLGRYTRDRPTVGPGSAYLYLLTPPRPCVVTVLAADTKAVEEPCEVVSITVDGDLIPGEWPRSLIAVLKNFHLPPIRRQLAIRVDHGPELVGFFATCRLAEVINL